MRVLAGDIGGTKTALAIVEIDEARVSLERSHRYPSREHASLEEILADFLAGERRLPRVAAFGVAGPVVGGRSRVTKLPWTLDERALSRATRIPRVRLLNDFVAAAFGIPYLNGRQLATLAKGNPEPGATMALLGAGTGLGQAALWRSGRRIEALASQGGHADFAPRDPREDRLLWFVRRRFGRVTWDRLLSGEGLGHIYDFLEDDGAAAQSPAVLRAFAGEDRAAVISRYGLSRRDKLCREALGMFVEVYGSAAGNLALQFRATGGVFVGGGIAPRILPALRSKAFLRAFRDKPPMDDLLARVPIRVVREARLGLYGAAAAAYRTAIDTTRLFSRRMKR
ncbi:MAG: glucokinase [Acidobacteriota bacterium]